MRKVSLILAVVLFASPAWAAQSTVTVTATTVVMTKNVTITYVSNLHRPRAFALRISVDSGATITAISNYHVGESTAGSKGYGIFPGTIDIDENGNVNDYGTPVAPSTAPDNPGQLGSSSIVIEMCSLYDANKPGDAPNLSGTLCTITVSKDCCVTLAVENAYRGGIVMENHDEDPIVVLVGTCCCPPPPEYPTCKPDYAQWVAVNRPYCWWVGRRQCHGDADGQKEGSTKTGYYYVHFNDLNQLLRGWNILQPATSGVPSGPGIKWDPAKPTDVNICGDIKHDLEGSTKTGYYRVHFSDLNTLLAQFNILEPATSGVPSGPGVEPDCLDCP